MSVSFLSPKGRAKATPALARLLNTLNLLSPLLLLAAVACILVSGCSNYPKEIKSLSARIAILYFCLALLIRIIWGIAIHRIRRK